MPHELALPLFDKPPTLPAEAFAREGRKRKQKRFEEEFAFQCRAFKLPPPIEQYYFAKSLGRRFTADFAWPQYRLLVEVQGGIFRPGGGAHSHPLNVERDIEKAQYIALLGLMLLPITPKNLKSGLAIELTQRILVLRGWRPNTGFNATSAPDRCELRIRD